MNKKYEEYILLDSLIDVDPKKQLDILGILFDGAIDRNSLEGIDKGLLLSEAIEYDLLEPHQKILFHYFISNAWATKRREKSTVFESAWEFNMQENAKELYHLRKAILIKDFDNLTVIRKTQIYTNLGNLLNVIGRFVEAHEFWNKALKIDPLHSMALSNKGKGFFYYGKYLFDEIHVKIFMLHSVLELKKSLKNSKDFYPPVLEDAIKFTEYLDSFISQEIQDNPPDLNDYLLGDNLQLKLYREWCLNNQLYINPLNDLGSYTIACHDCLNMPTLYFAFDQPPIYLTLYNQMKQEFGSARFLFYESLIDFHRNYL